MGLKIDEGQLAVVRRIIARPESLRQLSKARTVRLAAKGYSALAIAGRLGIPPRKVEARIAKFEKRGLDWLKPSQDQRAPSRALESRQQSDEQFRQDLEQVLSEDAELLRRLAQ